MKIYEWKKLRSLKREIGGYNLDMKEKKKGIERGGSNRVRYAVLVVLMLVVLWVAGGIWACDVNDGSGNIYVAGFWNRTGGDNFDVFVVKFDVNGNEIWNDSWGGGESDKIYSIAYDSAGYVVVSGTTRSYGEGVRNIFVMKYTLSGQRLWNVTWGKAGCYADGEEVKVDTSGNIYVAGSYYNGTSWELLLVKFDSSGNEIWNATWGLSDNDKGRGLVLNSAESVIYVVGVTYSYEPNGSIIVCCFYANGTYKVHRIWGGLSEDLRIDITRDDVDNIYVTGYTESFGSGKWDLVLLRYNSELTDMLPMTEVWGGAENDLGNSIIYYNSRIYITGWTWSYHPITMKMCILEYTTSGELVQYEVWGVGGEYGEDLLINVDGKLYTLITLGMYSSEDNVAVAKWEITPPETTTQIPGYSFEVAVSVIAMIGVIYYIISRERSIGVIKQG